MRTTTRFALAALLLAAGAAAWAIHRGEERQAPVVAKHSEAHVAALAPAAPPAVPGDGPVHNYLEVIAANGEARRETELNGWLLLEALLRRDLYVPLTPEHAAAIAEYGRERLAGWWVPRLMREGRKSIQTGWLARLPRDLDDSAWNVKLQGGRLRSDELQVFRTSAPPSAEIVALCREVGLKPNELIRTWEGADASWLGEIDLVALANAITVLDLEQHAQLRLFERNSAFINCVVESGQTARFVRYYDASLTAFLLLYYDDHVTYLSLGARAQLLEQWRHRPASFAAHGAVNCWGGCAQPAVIEGYRYRYINEVITELALRYAERWT